MSMNDHLLAASFEQNRPHLRSVAYRMLGSRSEADDAVQEAWLRLSRSAAADVANLTGWLTTVVARVCLDLLRTRRSRREDALDGRDVEPEPTGGRVTDPEHELMFSDSVRAAVLVVLETLGPAERVAFVLHDMFDVPFDEIAPIVGRSPAATRQLASRARRRVRAAERVPDSGGNRQGELVAAFLAASRAGDLAGLIAVLDPDVVLRADHAAVLTGATAEVRGAAAVAETFRGRARAARPALVDGAPGLVWAPGGTPRVLFSFTFVSDRIVAIELVADAERIARTELALRDRTGTPSM